MRTEVLSTHTPNKCLLWRGPEPLGPEKALSLHSANQQKKDRTPDNTPTEIPQLSMNLGWKGPLPPQHKALMPWHPAPSHTLHQPPELTGAVGGVPGGAGQAFSYCSRGSRRRCSGKVLVQVPLALGDLQAHGQVPFLVKGDLLAREGAEDLPEFLR